MREVRRGATQDNLDDWMDGTGRWDRKGVPHEKRWWNKKAHHVPSATFRSWFRCRKTTFRALVDALYGTTYGFRVKGTGPYVDPCERVAVFLFRVGGGRGVRETAGHFDIAEGTVVNWTMSIAKLVMERLEERYFRWPDPDEQRHISKEWEKEKELRNVVGATDGSHIKIPGPDEDKLLSYYNYKKFYSIILLAIVDNRGHFRWTCSGCPGSCGDSGVFQYAEFYKQAQVELAKPEAERTLMVDGSCILGDSAFAECPWLRTPYTMPVTRAERYFNFKHSSMRMRVEHAFGRLKMKFLCLQRGLLFRLEDCPLIIDTCCVLHNFICMHEGTWSAHTPLDDAPTRNGTGRSAGAAAGASGTARAVETSYLAGSFLHRDWGAPGSMADRRRAEREREWLEQETES